MPVYVVKHLVCKVTHQPLPRERIQSCCVFCFLPCYVQVTRGMLLLCLAPGSCQHDCEKKPMFIRVHLGPSSPPPCQIRSRILQALSSFRIPGHLAQVGKGETCCPAHRHACTAASSCTSTWAHTTDLQAIQ